MGRRGQNWVEALGGAAAIVDAILGQQSTHSPPMESPHERRRSVHRYRVSADEDPAVINDAVVLDIRDGDDPVGDPEDP